MSTRLSIIYNYMYAFLFLDNFVSFPTFSSRTIKFMWFVSVNWNVCLYYRTFCFISYLLFCYFTLFRVCGNSLRDTPSVLCHARTNVTNPRKSTVIQVWLDVLRDLNHIFRNGKASRATDSYSRESSCLFQTSLNLNLNPYLDSEG